MIRAELVTEPPSATSVEARRWRPASLTPLPPVHDSPLGRSAQGIAIGPRGETYLLRISDRTVERLGADGRPALSFIPDGVEGPEDPARPMPMDLEIAADGSLWVAYTEAGAVARFAATGELLRWEHTGGPPRRAVPWGEGGYAVLAGGPSDHMFTAHGGPEAEGATSFGRLIRGPQHPLLVDGDLAPDGRGGMIYTAYRAGVLAAFDAADSQRFVRRTVDATPLPGLVKVEGGRRHHVEAGSPLASSAVAVDGDAVYVLSAAGPGASPERPAVDVYALDDGSYRHSFRVPPGTVDLAVRGGVLYTLEEDRVRAWRMEPAAASRAPGPEPAG